MKTQGSVVEIGRVTGAHGLRGEVRVRWFGDGPETLLSLSEVRLGASIETAPCVELRRRAWPDT